MSDTFERHLANGTLIERGLLGEQGLEGLYEVFDSEGRPCLKCAYLGGERHGTSDYFKNGRLSMRQNLIQNQLHGITQSFDDSEGLQQSFLMRMGCCTEQVSSTPRGP